jgi:hypothetical protein
MNLEQTRRAIYEITRSEANELVELYYKCKRRSALKPKKTALERFIEKTRKLSPTYMGDRASDKGHARISTKYWQVIAALFDQLEDNDHYKKIMNVGKLLGPVKQDIIYTAVDYLNWAVYNWHLLNYAEPAPFKEDLSDNCYEDNTCVVCKYSGLDVFYFSTSFGVNDAVCQVCALDGEKEEEDGSEYEEEEEEESESEDEDYEEESGEEEEEEDDEEEEEEDYEGESDDEDYEGESDEEEDEDEDYESEPEEEEPEKKPITLDCEGCDYEWRAGWKNGWRAAMKIIRESADYNRKYCQPAPYCSNCKTSTQKLRRCGGTCGGVVMYCSSTCQLEDWRICHSKECSTPR